MKIKFDSNQKHQLEPIQSVVELFEGQIHLDNTDIDEIVLQSKLENGGIDDLTGLAMFSNVLTVNNSQIHAQLTQIQEEKGLSVTTDEEFEKNGLNFTVEMETGTGKTYVYLRTIFELNKKYGFKKFIAVVPNVAIREGVLKNLEITQSHFKSLYDIPSPDFFVYNADKLNKVNDFVSSENIQIMIINIQAFNKETAIFNKQHYKLNGYSPQEVIGESSPIVIIDEPQIVDNTEKGKNAIESLNPLFTLRYSATHREMYNQIHRLNPIDAFEQKLVKEIQVDGVQSSNEYNNAYISLLEIDNKNGIRAKVKINKQLAEGVKKEELWIKVGDDLYGKSSNRDEYKDGFEVQEINAGDDGYVEFSSQVMHLGDDIGSLKTDIVRVQLKSLIKSHFEKQRQVQGKLKVLSLIFLDKVSNYRLYDEDGSPKNGLYAEIFEEEYNSYITKFKPNNALPANIVHDGYFSADKGGKNKGIFKDTKGDAKDDADTYNKIMKDKEKLLSIEEPLQFIFSHSTLGVGWDNPNVFQICTLNETNSTIKKRQEIGRGLRLPVDINGERVRDENINILTVITNESYTEFVDKLQKEYEDDCGITFGLIKIDSFVSMVDSSGEILGLTIDESIEITESLKSTGIINSNGQIIKKDVTIEDLKTSLPEKYTSSSDAVYKKISEISSIKSIVKPKVEQKIIRLKYTHEELAKIKEFADLWAKISQKTTYRISVNTDEFVQKCLKAINEQLTSVSKIKLTITRAKVKTTFKGVESEEINSKQESVAYTSNVPNLVEQIKKKTNLKANTIATIIKGHKFANLVFDNPQEYIEKATHIIQDVLKSNLVEGITYEKLENEFWELKNFELEIPINHTKFVEANNSIYDSIVYDSDNEQKFVKWCDKFSGDNGNIKMYFKLPQWFKVSTPLGSYNPDWALVWENEPDMLYLVRETKTATRVSQLRPGEWDKIRCSKKHFETISNGNVGMYEVAVPNGDGGFEIGV